MIVLALLPALIIVALVLGSVWISFRTDILSPGLTLRHYIDLYSDPFAYRAFLNSIGFALCYLGRRLFLRRADRLAHRTHRSQGPLGDLHAS